jgi:DNA-binding GntR family transcriptional regulator
LFDNQTIDNMASSQPFSGIPRIETASAGEQLAVELRAAILRGEIAPGDALREVAIASAADVSRHTVREAIASLVRDGLAVHHRHRGAVVFEPTPADVIDVFRTRDVLELSAVDAWECAPEERRAAVGRAVAPLGEAATGRDWVLLTDRDLEFHAALVSLLGSERIDAFFRTVLTAVSLYFAMLYRGNQDEEDPRQIAREHAVIHHSLVAGDVPRARTLLAELLDTNRDRLLQLI